MALPQGVPVSHTNVYPAVNGVPVQAKAVAVGPAERPKTLTSAAASAALRKEDWQWSTGLCATVAQSVECHPMRIVLLDNSGSMREADGKRLVWHHGGYRSLGCSRWQELATDAVALGKMSAALSARTDFHLLNPMPGISGGVSLGTDAFDGGIAPLGHTVDVLELQRLLEKVNPYSTTPLTEALAKIISMIEPMAPKLRAAGQNIAVVICTDGLPNHKQSFVRAMRRLQTLPVWCVVRLCTDDDGVVDFWNDLDRQLEAPLEVLDDARGEAEEVNKLNPWLTYAPPLHLARLFGLHEKLFDALDEQALLPTQIRSFIRLLLGASADDLPEPELDREAFLMAVSHALADEEPVYDPKSGKVKPWLDMHALDRALRPRQKCEPGCAIM